METEYIFLKLWSKEETMASVFVTLCDLSYFERSLLTIRELRTNGKWEGDIVLIAVDFDPHLNDMENVITHRVSHIDHGPLFEAWRGHPIRSMEDDRHYKKVHQWDKLQVFDAFFKKWRRVIFIDAGMRVMNNVYDILQIEGTFVAPDDSDPYDDGRRIGNQLDMNANPGVTEAFLREFGQQSLSRRCFLNCIFMFDTDVIDDSGAIMRDLLGLMYRYPICLCNEMGVMNMYFGLRHDLWTPLPQKTRDGKHYLFGWCEANYKERPLCSQFCFIKYPVTASS